MDVTGRVELTRDDVVALLADQHGVVIKAATWSAYVSKGQAPPPRAQYGATPVWWVQDVEAYAANRVGRGRKAPVSWPARAPRVDSPRGHNEPAG